MAVVVVVVDVVVLVRRRVGMRLTVSVRVLVAVIGIVVSVLVPMRDAVGVRMEVSVLVRGGHDLRFARTTNATRGPGCRRLMVAARDPQIVVAGTSEGETVARPAPAEVTAPGRTAV